MCVYLQCQCVCVCACLCFCLQCVFASTACACVCLCVFACSVCVSACVYLCAFPCSVCVSAMSACVCACVCLCVFACSVCVSPMCACLRECVCVSLPAVCVVKCVCGRRVKPDLCRALQASDRTGLSTVDITPPRGPVLMGRSGSTPALNPGPQEASGSLLIENRPERYRHMQTHRLICFNCRMIHHILMWQESHTVANNTFHCSSLFSVVLSFTAS